MQNVRKSDPWPPYSSGNGSPNRPSSPICRAMSTGTSSVRLNSSARGAIPSSANARTALRKSFGSSVRSKSMAPGGYSLSVLTSRPGGLLRDALLRLSSAGPPAGPRGRIRLPSGGLDLHEVDDADGVGVAVLGDDPGG